jgi:[acyl-carrier-protein] S-malonyltransferase
MQDAVPLGAGAVAAILGLDDQRVRDVCEAAAQNEVVSAVNFNAPGQVVVAGHRGAVDRAVEGAKTAGAKRALLLPVSVPVHCALMELAAESLRAKLVDTQISTPSIRILHNVDVAFHEDPEVLREVLVKQLYSPVLWADSIRRIAEDGIGIVAECGPGKVLTGLTRRIDKGLSALSIFDGDSLDDALEKLGSEP